MYVNSDGEQEWAKVFAGVDYDDYARGCSVSRDGNYGFITGSTRSTGYSNNPGYWNTFLLKINLNTGALDKEKIFRSTYHSESGDVMVDPIYKMLLMINYFQGTPYGYVNSGNNYNNGVHFKMTQSLDDFDCLTSVTSHSLSNIYSDWVYGKYG